VDIIIFEKEQYFKTVTFSSARESKTPLSPHCGLIGVSRILQRNRELCLLVAVALALALAT